MRVCRVCLARSSRMYHMFEHKLNDMFERVTGVEINSEDKLPKMICWECVARLSSANTFVKKALKTQRILFNTIIGDIITMSDIATIDRAQHGLESTLGFKHEVNKTDLHIQSESDIPSEDHDASNVGLMINKCKDELNDVETVTIKCELLDVTEEPEEADLQVPKPIIIAVHKDREVCEAIKQERDDFSITPLNYWNNRLPFDKELKVVLEDVMLPLGKQNTQSTFGEAANNDVSYLNAHLSINKGTLTNSNNTDTDSGNAIEVRFIYPRLENTHVFPKNTNKKVCARTSIVNSNTDFTHYKVASSKNVFICDICNKTYQNKKYLYKHIQRHLNLFNCTYCSYTGHNKGDLNKHINTIHTKRTVYSCSYCSYRAYARNTLTKHVNSKHTKETVYNCSYCSYKTYISSILSSHVNSKHTKKTVYYCSYCNYKAYVRSRLNSHVNSKHTRKTVYNC